MIPGLAETLVFLDYALASVAGARQHRNQNPGLDPVSADGRLVIPCGWFSVPPVVPALEHGVPMTGGPYRRVRHPRHAGLFFTRLWWLLIERRIRRDERYLRARVGSAYGGAGIQPARTSTTGG